MVQNQPGEMVATAVAFASDADGMLCRARHSDAMLRLGGRKFIGLIDRVSHYAAALRAMRAFHPFRP